MSNVRSLSDGKEGLSNQLALLFENDWEDIVVKMMYFGFRVFITCVWCGQKVIPQALCHFLEMSIASTKQRDQISSPECPKSVSSHACSGRRSTGSVSKGLELSQRTVPYQPEPLQVNAMFSA